MDDTTSDRGRLSARAETDQPLSEVPPWASWMALRRLCTTPSGGRWRMTASAGTTARSSTRPVSRSARCAGRSTHGVITVLRPGRPNSEDDLAPAVPRRARISGVGHVQEHLDVQRQAITDDLTGLSTHGHFQELLGAEMDEVRRYTDPVGVVMIDIDNFKSVNDGYGHQQGDRVLRQVSSILRETKREVDVAARHGGESSA